MNIYILNTTSTGILATEILSDYLQVKGIITLSNAGQSNEFYDYSDLCTRKGLEFVTIEDYSLNNLRDKDVLLGLGIDLLLVLGWQRLVPGWLIRHCKIGVIGGHGSVNGISDGRGRSPQNWALLFGAKQFSMSIFWIDEGVDSGKVIDTKVVVYSDVDDIMSSYIKTGMALVDMVIENIENGKIPRHFGLSQSDIGVGYLPKRTPEDGMIDWDLPCDIVYNYVRAQTIPYPCAFTVINGEKIKIVDAKFIDMEYSWLIKYLPGQIISILAEKQLLVKCGSGMLQILKYEKENEDIELRVGAIFDSASFENQMERIIGRHKRETKGLTLSKWLMKSLEDILEE